MNPGTKIGGPIATPIRTMLTEKHHDGVIFECDNSKRAETTRYAAIMLKRRNDYTYKTKRLDNNLIVYKDDVDPFEMRGAIKVKL